MASKKQLEKKLADLRDSLDAVPDEFKADIQKEIEETEKELASATDDDGAKPAKKATPQAGESGDDFLKAMLSTIAAQMAAGEGSGVDSSTVRAIIKDYLDVDKVKLNELDKSVLEEIKKIDEEPILSSAIKTVLGDDYSYGEIRAVLAHNEYLKSLS